MKSTGGVSRTPKPLPPRRDLFGDFVTKNTYVYNKPLPPRIGEAYEPYKEIGLSFDKFGTFLTEIKERPILVPISITIYDEGQNINESDNLRRIHLLKALNDLNIKNALFILSDSTLPVYNEVMSVINWHHSDKTSLKMKIDRNPALISGRDLKLEKAKGTLIMSEEQLYWQPDFVLSKLLGKVDERVLRDTDLLRTFVRDFYEGVEKTYYGVEKAYHGNRLTDFDKLWIAYNFVRRNIGYAGECTSMDNNGNTILKPSDTGFDPRWESRPCGTLEHGRGVCSGQARLLRVLLNNYFMGLDSTTISGTLRTIRRWPNRDKEELHEWGGTVIEGKLYQYCTTTGKFLITLNTEDRKYIPDINEIYPKVYPIGTKDDKEVERIKTHVKCLRRIPIDYTIKTDCLKKPMIL